MTTTMSNKKLTLGLRVVHRIPFIEKTRSEKWIGLKILEPHMSTGGRKGDANYGEPQNIYFPVIGSPAQELPLIAVDITSINRG